MIEKLIGRLKKGDFTYRRMPSDWNRMGSYFMQGAHVYSFGNGIELRTYTRKSWLLYVDNELVFNAIRGQDDEKLAEALEASKLSKLEAF